MKMSCRACLLLEKDLRELERNPLSGVNAYVLESKPLVCYATLSGLKGTEIEKGVFELGLKFTEHYNQDFPEIFFNTILFHPNIDSKTGKLDIDFKKYLPKNVDITLRNILIFVQNILAHPINEDPVNIDAYNLLQNDVSSYKKAAEYCARNTQAVGDKLSENVFRLEKVGPPTKCPPKQIEEIYRSSLTDPKQVSFDYYYQSWKDIATTSSKSQYATEENHQSKPTLLPRAEYSSNSSTPELNKRTLKPPQNTATGRNRVDIMKKLYLNHLERIETTKINNPKSDYFPPNITPKQSQTDLIDDTNVDELIDWTKELNEDQFD